MSDGPKDIDELLAIPELAPIAPALRQQILPALRMRHAPGLPRPVDDTPPGADKLGGLADVPRSLADPIYRRRRLVLQLDLARAHALVPGLTLPRQGLLHVLHDTETDTDDARAIALRVVTVDEPLRREPGPKFTHRARPLTLELEQTLPDTDDPALAGVGFPEDDDEVTFEAWFQARGALRRPPTHRLLGWPDWVQDPSLPDPPAPARGWRLLPQIDSAGNGLDWGDSGCLYIFLPDLDFYAGRLDRAHIFSQSC
ncbi:DUF1963 domain-containing protein [Nannocystis sp. SCPEA4]|uniref:DUF1963 domain-containing protein n=1 Tax=Nannocystis sp. SCPEA4 TaxID=2996787 RepID=UPI0022705039|nr:DUF1963 domain-containing protein [Nannocystis sp. SCPEA4]MCY1056180.1 DUF1963 domain-containing protein [Nannocystis sp. SCPEA4]